jgi:hypothetical protein
MKSASPLQVLCLPAFLTRDTSECWKTNSHDSTVVTRMMGAYNSGFEMLGAPQK